MKSPSFTIGIEEEYQTIDPETRELRSHVQTEIISKGNARIKESVKAEMHQSVVEVGTPICRDMREARHQGEGTAPGDDLRSPPTPACCSLPALRTRSPIGASRRSIPTSATASSSRTCSSSPAPT